MTQADWNRSQARQMMIDHLRNGTALPDVMIDDVLHIFFARVGSCLLTRSEILIQGEHAQDDRKEQCRQAYKRIQVAMKEHAQRIGMGRHADQPTQTPTTDGNRSGGVNRKRNRQDDRRGGSLYADDTAHVTSVPSLRNEQHASNDTSRVVPARTGSSKRVADSNSQRRHARTADVQRTKKGNVKVKRKRSTVAPSKRKR